MSARTLQEYLGIPTRAESHAVDRMNPIAKASLLIDGRKKSLLFFLHGMALRFGGFKQLAADLVATLPERLGSRTMHRLGMASGQLYSQADADSIIAELRAWTWEDWTLGDETACYAKSRRTVEYFLGICRERAEDLDRFLSDLCTCPDFEIRIPGESRNIANAERQRLADSASGRTDQRRGTPDPPYFHDVMGALFEYQRRVAERALQGMADTEISKVVFKTLDRALQHRKMVVLEGAPGIGKTKAAETWCESHLGQARFVTLKGCVNKTSIFRTIARALGLAAGYHRGAAGMQVRIEDAIAQSRLMLVIDEAHFLFPQGDRGQARPEMLDWIDTALCNEGVPVALIATPQFRRRLQEAERRTIWQSAQFRRRIRDYSLLAAKVRLADVEAVARRMLPEADGATAKLLSGHALLSEWPLSWLQDAAEDARAVAREQGRDKVEFSDVESAIEGYRNPSDLGQRKAFAQPAQGQGRRWQSADVIPGTRSEVPEEELAISAGHLDRSQARIPCPTRARAGSLISA